MSVVYAAEPTSFRDQSGFYFDGNNSSGFHFDGNNFRRSWRHPYLLILNLSFGLVEAIQKIQNY